MATQSQPGCPAGDGGDVRVSGLGVGTAWPGAGDVAQTESAVTAI